MDVISFIVIGTLVMLLLAAGIVTFFFIYQRRILNHQLEIKSINERKQQELLQASIQSEEEERMRIASELHDDVGATLSSIRLFLHKIDTDSMLLQESRQLLDQSIQSVRNISHRLQPGVLYHLGLQASLQSFTETISKSGGIKINYSSDEQLGRLTDNSELSLYRIVQELVNNIIKHSQASTISIQTVLEADKVKLILGHDGIGLTNEVYNQQIFKKGAVGLKNIESRLKSVDGTIDFTKNGEKDFLVMVIIPHKPKV